MHTLDYDSAYQDFVVDRMPSKEMAAKYGYSRPSHLRRRLRSLGIPARKPQDRNFVPRPCRFEDYAINNAQKQVIYGSMLGDGFLRKLRPGLRNSFFTCRHTVAHKQYVEWLAYLLRPLANIYEYNYPETRPGWPQRSAIVVLQTASSSFFTDLRQLFYPQGKKIAPMSVLRFLDSLGLAVWYMDDGCYDKRWKRIFLHTEGFPQFDQEIIVRCLQDRFGTSACNTVKCSSGTGVMVSFTRSGTDAFLDLVRPHVFEVPCMRYKLGC